MIRFLKKTVILAAILLFLIVGAYGFVLAQVLQESNAHIYSSVDSVPENQVALVLGAQVFPGEIPSTALAYRLSTAVALYRAHKVSTLLMSGDGRSRYYDEVTTMKQYAMGAGIPEADIRTDDAGLRTYASCYRVKHEFNISKVTIVTQADHLARAIYTCRKLGVDAIGVVAPEYTSFKIDSPVYWRTWLREKGALVLAWYEVTYGSTNL